MLKEPEVIPVHERLEKESKFFEKHFTMSYSGLSKLLFSPASFYNHYVLKVREDVDDKHMIVGKLIHCLLLKPESFEEQFVLNVTDTPSDNPRMLLKTLYNHYKELKQEDKDDERESLTDFSPAIIDILSDMKLYQTLKTDAQRLDKIINEKHENYWEYLKKSEGRSVIDQNTYNFAESIVDNIKSNPTVMEVMGYFGDSFNGITQQNEIGLVGFQEGLLFGLYGLIDNLVFDPIKKEIRINDLKKTSKTIKEFPESIEYYKYWLQAGMYYKLVSQTYLSLPQYKDWNIVVRFIVVDPYGQIGPVRIGEETMKVWLEKTEDALQEANIHFETRDFSMPVEFLTSENKELVL
jgi:hypothetical protein